MFYKKFEEIPVWQQTRKFVSQIYKITDINFKKDYSLIDQLRRASVSILLNIAEGFERHGNKEFARYINIAKGSAGEVRAILYLAYDNQYLNEKEFEILYNEIESISRQLFKFNQFLLNNNH